MYISNEKQATQTNHETLQSNIHCWEDKQNKSHYCQLSAQHEKWPILATTRQEKKKMEQTK